MLYTDLITFLYRSIKIAFSFFFFHLKKNALGNFQTLSREQIFILRSSVYFIYHTSTMKVDGNTLPKKLIFILLQLISISSNSSKLIILLLLKVLLPEFWACFMKIFGLDQIKMGWINLNSVRKQKLLTRKNLRDNFQ